MASDVRPSYYCGASGCGADLAECRGAVTRGWGDAAWALRPRGSRCDDAAGTLFTQHNRRLPSWPEGLRP